MSDTLRASPDRTCLLLQFHRSDPNMIRRVTIKRFKRFRDQAFELADSVVLAGPNNSGKTTLLQAISAWKLGLDRWIAQRSGSNASRRSGVPISRADFTAVPVREMNLLWEGRKVTGPKGAAGGTRLIEIAVEGEADGKSWTCALEFRYANRDQVYVRPRVSKDSNHDAIREFPPTEARNLSVIHVPPLSGIEREEPRRERGMQDLLIGQGRPGEILRNLLWELSEANAEDWSELSGHVRDLFGITLEKPSYSPVQPFIVCEYAADSARPLDLSNAGSGTLQVLLLLAFLYARPASLILLDEPDAHQHIILQRQVYDLVRKVARDRGGQAIVATHSEVILDATEPNRVLGFIGDAPALLTHKTERNRLRQALKRLTTTDLLLGRDIGAVLYVEGESDERILGEWSRKLDHPARVFFDRPFVHWLGGRSLREAREHYFALRAAFPQIHAVCLLDGDNRDEPDEEVVAAGLLVLRWRRYEIENYLLQPEAIKRFIGDPNLEQHVDEGFWKQVPHGTDLFGDHVSLSRIKASHEFLVPLLEEIRPTPKRDLYLLAAGMQIEEIHSEVVRKLSRIAFEIRYGSNRQAELADSYGGRVYLVAVDVMGTKRQPYLSVINVDKAKVRYVEYEHELNRAIDDPRLKNAVHALTEENSWPDDLPSVHHGGSYASDRSCHPDRCDCEALGFPVHSDPHAPSY